jgi:hypothetical protein
VGPGRDVPQLQRKTKLRVALRYSKAKKLIALFFDGKLIRQWNETEEWAAKGGCLVFQAHGQGPFRITNLSVTAWDGRLEDASTATANDADLVRLNNGDKLSGQVKKIENGQVMLAASFAEMNVPVERVTAIEFASVNAERARRHAEDVRAVFSDGNRLTLALERLDEQQLVGTSENCGKVTAVLAAFRRIQFRIYEKPIESGDDEDWGTEGSGAAQDVMIDE